VKAIIKKVIQIAEKEVGVREVGDNMGKRVNEYQRADTLGGVGYAWCGSFISWCLKEADANIEYCYSASCDIIAAWAKSQGLLHDRPEVGDIFLLFARGSYYDAVHTGLVVKVEGAEFSTIEGNTNLDGSRAGIGVFSLKRTNGDRYRFVRWADLHGAAPGKYQVLIDGKEIESQMVGAATFVPVRVWGEALGFEVQWNNDKQVPLFDGREVPVQIHKLDQRGWAWVRALAAFSELNLKVDAQKRLVSIQSRR